MSSEGVHYWLANVPQDQWPKECPEFLKNISERDRKIVGTLDKDFCRLTWPEVKQAVGDIKILYNDWPYGIDERIVHLVVWTNFDLNDEEQTDELSPQMRDRIDDYVSRTFRQKVPAEDVYLIFLNLLAESVEAAG
ncbi:MAG: hypothetical protein LQ351_001020 [Letrouitia transgressa]|nr:MAG: hypothetical protein LQ351_001020 [Letrouitia transgressa]